MDRILFICVHNSGRSQMAEAYMNELSEGRYKAESAGFEPTALLPQVVEVMREDGIDISDRKADSVFDFYREGRLYSAVVTVCDDQDESQCPVFPGVTYREHWPFPDPERIEGEGERARQELRDIRDAIKDRIKDFIIRMDAARD